MSMSVCVACLHCMHTRLCVSASKGQKRESEALSWKSLGAAGCGYGSGCRAVDNFCPLKSSQCSEAVLPPAPPLSPQFPEALNCSTLGEQTQYLQDVSHPPLRLRPTGSPDNPFHIGHGLHLAQPRLLIILQDRVYIYLCSKPPLTSQISNLRKWAFVFL